MICLRERRDVPLPRVPAFYRAQLFTMKTFGRSYELGMIALHKLFTGDFKKDMELGIRMFKKGKLKLLPGFTGMWTMRGIFNRVKHKERPGS